MDNLIYLSDVKNKKKVLKYLEDINNILKVILLSQKSLTHFKQYTPVQEMISVLETNKVLLELHKKKYETKLEEIEKKHS